MMRSIVKRMIAATFVAAMALTMVPVTDASVVKAADETPSFPVGSQEPTDAVLPGQFNQDIIVNFANKCYIRTYSFTAAENGYAVVEVKNYNPSSDKKTTTTLTNDIGNTMYNAYQQAGIKTVDFPVTAGRTYYVKMAIAYLYGGSHTDVLRFDFTASDGWESEGNGTSATADPIKEGQTITGFIDDTSDKDYFKLTLNKDCNLSVSLSPRSPGSSAKWEFSLVNSDGEIRQIGYGISSRTVGSYPVKKGTYYMLVNGSIGWHLGMNQGDNKYLLTYTTTPLTSAKTPTVKSFRGYRGTYNDGSRYVHIDEIDLSKAGKNVTGYRLKIAKNKKMKGILYDKTFDVTYPDRIRNLDTDIDYKGKKVYVTVQPYIKDPFGHEIWGKRSKVKAVKLSLKK